jgi:PAS domain S-box-containing protein
MLTGVERHMQDHDIIVSKTDVKGRITYANDVFCDLASYHVTEVIGEPHSMIRNPTMPRCVFKLLWDTIMRGEEMFAYVNNRAKNGDHYWVLAHVTPSCNERGEILGYHSNRRKPSASAVRAVDGLYRQLLAEEKRFDNRKDGMQAGYDMLMKFLQDKGVSYEEFILSL